MALVPKTLFYMEVLRFTEEKNYAPGHPQAWMFSMRRVMESGVVTICGDLGCSVGVPWGRRIWGWGKEET